jgi:hypothetical protein
MTQQQRPAGAAAAAAVSAAAAAVSAEEELKGLNRRGRGVKVESQLLLKVKIFRNFKPIAIR